MVKAIDILKQFLSTPSVGRATICVLCAVFIRSFLSTPSVGRATWSWLSC